MGKRSKLQIVQDSRRRLENRSREIEASQRRIVKETIAAIFEALGIPVTVGDNYLNHHAGGVTVSQSGNGFTVETNKDKGPKITVFVLDESDSRLQQFSRLLATWKEVV